MEVPAGAESSTPAGQYSACGNILMMGMAIEDESQSDGGDVLAGQRLLNTPIHAQGSKSLGAFGQGSGEGFAGSRMFQAAR